ncbi:MAG TPA: MlaE family lipid ABC transporter permease subunit [Sphingomonadaceae bacterium]|nr:MlaE family lipid ABC transporter permease subunit [Sphingomonadaceae bacterium]
MPATADFQPSARDGGQTLSFTGALTLARVGGLSRRLEAVDRDGVVLDLSGVERMDTVGAWLIHRLVRDRAAVVKGADPDMTRLLDQVAVADQPVQIHPDRRSPVTRVLGEIGGAVSQAGHNFLGLVGFFGATMVALWSVITHPRRFRMNAVVQQFENVGLKALGIVGLMSFLIGLVIAQQGAVQLAQFGAEVFTVNLIGRSAFRELGVLMTAIMVAGRSGSAFAAQIGTMKLTEEVDAMRTIGVSPMEALVLPRVLATVLMMPLLAFYSAVIAAAGGGVFCYLALDIPPATYVQRIREVVPLTDFYVGLIKAPVFGAMVAIAGCFQGMQVEADAEQVGLRTTAAVVQAIFLVFVLDAVFAVFFSSIGWI